MNQTLNILDRIKIASPCPVSWSSMHGDDRVRYCGQCKLNVYNLSAMTSVEVAKLIVEKEGRLCGAIFRRPDGTAITKNCPVGLRLARKRLIQTASGFAAAFSLLIGCAAALGNPWKRLGFTRLRRLQPLPRLVDAVEGIRRRLSPPPGLTGFRTLGGDIDPDPELIKELQEYLRIEEAAAKGTR